ncbi:MAG TPA: FtsX-like permease family protein [bacterium]|nr:FtsX-like permease family protein [bacterium]
MLARHRNLLAAAAENVARNARGYLVAASGLVLALTLLLAGVAISEGLRAEALGAVRAGADVYVTWDRFGRDVPVPRDRVAELASIDGVVAAVPRIVGRVPLGERLAVVVGVPRERLADAPVDVRGALPASAEEVLLGHELARALGLHPGSTIALDGETLRLFTVSGVVSATSSFWSAKAVICDLEEAAVVFGDPDHVTDVCLITRAGYEGLVAEAVERRDSRFRVQTRGLVERYVVRGMTTREGVFTVLFALALALAIPSFAIMTWLGRTPRRREIGLLKAEGWKTTDVLEMVAWENLIVSLFAAGAALLFALIWVRLLRAPGIAPFFLPDLPEFPGLRIPARFTPVPPLLAFLFSFAVTMTGSIWSTWRTAITRPADVLR